MRRTIALLALWLTAAVVCTTLGWLTVGMVSGRSRQSTLAPLLETATTSDDAAAVVRPRPAITPGSGNATPPASSMSATSATIASTGGSVAVSYDASAGTVTLLWVTSHHGFTMNVQDSGPDVIEVHFEGDGAESRVFAWWDGDPRQRVEERD